MTGPRNPPTQATRQRMVTQRRRDTQPELQLRRELHRRGLRFRVDHAVQGLPRKRVDIAFTRARVAVFVDGCFWHGCPLHSTVPKNNSDWWREKLAGNIARDRGADQRLAGLGWRVFRIWEHDDPMAAADSIEAAARGGESGPG